MMHTVSTFDLKTLGLADMYGMYKLRYEVFAKKLGWDVETFNEMEKDHYDDLPRVSYVLAKTSIKLLHAGEYCLQLAPTCLKIHFQNYCMVNLLQMLMIVGS